MYRNTIGLLTGLLAGLWMMGLVHTTAGASIETTAASLASSNTTEAYTDTELPAQTGTTVSARGSTDLVTSVTEDSHSEIYVEMNDTSAMLNENLTITCTLTTNGSWGMVVLFRSTDSGKPHLTYRPQAAFSKAGNVVSFSNSVHAKMASTEVGQTFTVVYPKVSCWDAGLYLCKADKDVSASATVKVITPVTVPKTRIPSNVVSGKHAILSCEAAVNLVGGQVFWSVRRPGETEFTRVLLDGSVQEITEVTSCQQTLRLISKPVMIDGWDGTEIRCQTLGPEAASKPAKLSVANAAENAAKANSGGETTQQVTTGESTTASHPDDSTEATQQQTTAAENAAKANSGGETTQQVTTGESTTASYPDDSTEATEQQTTAPDSSRNFISPS